MHQMPMPPPSSWFLLFIFTSVLAWLVLDWRFPTWFVVGFLWTAVCIEQRLQRALWPEFAQTDQWVTGWVDSFPNYSVGQTSFSFQADADVAAEGLPGRLRLTWYDPPADIQAGDAYKLLVRLKEPRGLSNPGGFDYERWLFLQGYGATGYVREGSLQSIRTSGIARWWLNGRMKVARAISAGSPGADAPVLLTALVLGERSGFADRHWRGLRRTGTSHLIAISGMHVGLVATFFFFIVRRIWLRLPTAFVHYDLLAAAICSFGAAALYAAAAGFAVPTQRALVMIAIAHIAILARRYVSMTTGLSAALLFVILWDPFSVLSASFWLSFIAVALIWQLATQRTVSRSPQDFVSKFRTFASIQWGITLGLAPLVVIYFGELSIVAPLINFVAIPVFTLILVPLTLLATLTLSIDPVGPYLLLLSGMIAQGLWWALEIAAAWQWSAVTIPQANYWQLMLATIGVIWLLPIHPLPGRYLGVLALLPVLIGGGTRPMFGDVVATVLDVGHGLAVVIQTQTHTLLYDAGPRYRSGFNSGRDIVLPALHTLGISALDKIVVSHADNDHAGGIEAVHQAYPQAQLVGGPDLSFANGASCRRGWSWFWDGVEFSFLHPPSDYDVLGNDSSCVLKVAAVGGTLIIPGDIEADGERTLLRDAIDLSANVVVVPHHGSSTSSSANFVTATNARYAIVSAAYENHWNFPRPEVQARWQAAGAQILTTGRGGAITISIGSAGEPSLLSRRDRRRRYWHATSSRTSG
jgi:competence protein ComEC